MSIAKVVGSKRRIQVRKIVLNTVPTLAMNLRVFDLIGAALVKHSR